MAQKNSTLTPKRKSILWNYQENGNVEVIAIKSKEQKQINEFYNDEISCLDSSQAEDVSVNFNNTATRIWEQCDGINTIDDIFNSLSKEFDVKTNDLINDLDEFLRYCACVDIIDVNWKSLE